MLRPDAAQQTSQPKVQSRLPDYPAGPAERANRHARQNGRRVELQNRRARVAERGRASQAALAGLVQAPGHAEIRVAAQQAEPGQEQQREGQGKRAGTARVHQVGIQQEIEKWPQGRLLHDFPEENATEAH